ncbi:hypothetical protein C8N28_2391 [Albibacterium bauzanense]|uniref:Uncharacterized protein n=1 Tax=Albibacterium bauzanense TaxID=653929 RepID=A0A4R1LQB4_9SPHI|nr:hypothetical protein C8N28_2391 [Albibacterium bauzanense]
MRETKKSGFNKCLKMDFFDLYEKIIPEFKLRIKKSGEPRHILTVMIFVEIDDHR